MSEASVSEKDNVTEEIEDSTTESSKKRTTRSTARRGRPKKGSSSREEVEEDNAKDNAEEDETKKEDQSVEEPELKCAVNGEVEKSSDQTSDKGSKEKEEIVEPEPEKEKEEIVEPEPEKEKEEIAQADNNEIPELEEAPPPPAIAATNTPRTLKLRTSFSNNDNEETEEKKNEEKVEDDSQIPEEFTVVEEVESDSDDVQEVPLDKMEVDSGDTNKTSPQGQTLEGMTVIDEVVDETEKKDSTAMSNQDSNLDPDTEMVSEDELPAEVNKEPLETEAVSDEELPTSGDLPETEAVSEDELPPEGAEKKKRKSTPSKGKLDADGKKEAGEGGTKKESSKRKLVDGEYDPSSPTSEASDDSPAAKKAATDGKSVTKPTTKANKVLPELEKYWKAVKEDATDFTGWTYLLQYVDQENDLEAAREAYDSFLSHYPYCYGYWRKYADYERRKGNKTKCEEVFERGLKAIPFSVDLWLHYINYCKATVSDEDFIRSTFEKALDACGLEFRSDRLWEAYLKWETENKNLQNITEIYDRLLATPTQGYQSHFDAFCTHVSNNPPSKILSTDEFLTLRQEVLQELKQSDTPLSESVAPPGDDMEAPPGEEPAGEAVVVLASPEETAKLREKISAVRRKVHLVTKDAVVARQNYEEGIKRPYFHVKPLERCQLKNWKDYLEYETAQGDQKRIIVLFERCLIACALYEEFWIRYLRYLEDKGNAEGDTVRDVYERACTIHHKKKPGLHLHWAVYEEMQGNFTKAEDILENLEKLVPNLIQVTYRRINLARRSGDSTKVAELYERYIEKAKNRIIANNMTIKYARFCWKILNDVDRAVSILKNALEKDKENPRLYLQLIDMAMQRAPVDEEEVIGVIDLYLARDAAELEQRVMFAQRKIEFLEDFGSSVKSVQKATDEFQKLLKQLQEKKKKIDDIKGKMEEPSIKKIKPDIKDSSSPSHLSSSQLSQPPPNTPGQYSAPSYNQSGSYNQPPAQNNYQGGYNQQPPYNQPPYNQQYNQNDPNYNNYQSWGYSQTGYGNYNQGWGGYNYY